MSKQPTKPIEVTEQIPVAVPVPSVPRPELFVAIGWDTDDDIWHYCVYEKTPSANELASTLAYPHIFRIPGEAEMGAKAERDAQVLQALRSASLVLMGCVGTNDENELERAEAIAALRTAIASAAGGAG